MNTILPFSQEKLLSYNFNGLPITQVKLIGAFQNGVSELTLNFTAYAEYGAMESELSGNVSQSMEVNFAAFPTTNTLIELDITALVLANIATSDYFTISFRNSHSVEFQLIEFIV